MDSAGGAEVPKAPPPPKSPLKTIGLISTKLHSFYQYQLCILLACSATMSFSVNFFHIEVCQPDSHKVRNSIVFEFNDEL